MLLSIHWHVYDAPLNQASFPSLQYFISFCYQTEHQKTVACCYFRVYKSSIHQDSVVSVVTRLWDEHSGVQFLLRPEIFHLQNALNNPALYATDTQGSFLEVKQPRREVDHSLPSSVKVKNQQTYTLPPPLLPQTILPDKSITLIKSCTIFQDLLPYLILSLLPYKCMHLQIFCYWLQQN